MEKEKIYPKINIALMIVFTIVTIGFYIPVWFLRRKDWLNHLSATKKLGFGVIIFLLIFCISTILGLTQALGENRNDALSNIGSLINLVHGIIIVILVFRVRKILDQHFNQNLKMNIRFSGLCTFFFTIFYLQYMINRLSLLEETSGDTV